MSPNLPVSIHEVDYEEPPEQGDLAFVGKRPARRVAVGENALPLWHPREETPRRAKPAPRSRKELS